MLLLFFIISMTTGSRVLELSDRFLDIRKEGVWLVKFYAPWCGHCKKLEPIYSHVAQSLHDTPVRVGRVDCTRFPSVAKEFSVVGFPTIMFIKPTTSHLYTGDRTTTDLVAYAKRMMGPPVRPFDPLLGLDSSHLVFYGSKNSSLFEAFLKVAEGNQQSFEFFVEEKEGEGEIHLFHPPSPPKMYEKGKKDNHTLSILQFLTRNKFPPFPKITRSNFQDLLSTEKLLPLGVVHEDKLGRVTDPVQQQFLLALEKMVGVFPSCQFGWTGSVDMARSIASTDINPPTLLIINSTSFEHFLLQSEGDGGEMETFLVAVLGGVVKPLGGSSLLTRLYRTYYELSTNLVLMFQGNPVLTSLMFGLPLGFLTLIFYSICCSDILDASTEEEITHEKRE